MNRVIIRGLLGAAAGIAMVSGAQAADMPVKAKAVEYVKICSAYGAGFYYIPGTDICLRVGGYVYYEFGVKATSAVANIYSSNDGIINSSYNYYNSRTSAKVTLDARQNTAYGTLRATATFGPTNANHSTGAGLDNAYIQFAGFTWGYTNSFFSFGGAYSIVASPAIDWAWVNLFAYTAQLGNGLTASVSFEDPQGRRADINGVTTQAGTTVTYTPGALYGGRWMPDVVGNINVTQAWGRAQIMGAIHQVKPAAALVPLADSEYGFAIGAGIEIKTPQTGNPNNSFLLQGVWSEGAVDYTGYNSSPTAAAPTAFTLLKFNGLGAHYAVNDAVVWGPTGELNLVEAWSVYAAYRHYWTPMLRTGFYAGFLNIEEPARNPLGAGQGELDVVQAGVSTVWSPVSGLDLSLDVVYSKLENTGRVNAAGVAAPTLKNDIISVWSRLRRNF